MVTLIDQSPDVCDMFRWDFCAAVERRRASWKAVARCYRREKASRVDRCRYSRQAAAAETPFFTDASRWKFAPERSKRRQGVGFVVFDVEQFVQLRNGKHFIDLRANAAELEPAAV